MTMVLQNGSLGPQRTYSNDRPAELANVTSLAAPETAAAVLITEDEDVLTNMASLVPEVNDSGVQRNLHGDMNNAVKYIAKR
jgi:hypothetical protein